MASRKERMNQIKGIGRQNERNQNIVKKMREETGSAFLEENMFWDELNKQAHDNFYILRAHAGHSVSLKCEELMARVADRKLLYILVQGLTKHLNDLNAELTGLHSIHKERTGGARTHDEVSVVMELFDRYATYNERHELILMPTTSMITNIVTAAEEQLVKDGLAEVVTKLNVDLNEFINRVYKLPEAQPAPEPLAPEQDPTVVTDVEVK